jgi:DNA helicase IV
MTVSDVALLDEAAELLGESDDLADANKAERRNQRKRDLENAEQAIRNMGVEGLVDAQTLAEGFEASVDRGTTAERAASDREWTYGHIVVDEAQELSPMQWRLLMRRNPLKSFTIVGDVAQASAAAGSTSWEGTLRPHLGSNWRLEELTVNYRTPAQIAAVAESMAIAHGVAITRSRAVRSSEWPVEVIRAHELEPAVLDAVERDRELDAFGTIAVIASEGLLPGIHAQLAQRFGADVARGAAGLTKPIALLTPQEVKGLEFDSAIVVDPQRIVTEIPRGAAALYVAMTRPTQRLTIVTTGVLPAGIESQLESALIEAERLESHQ